MAYVYRSDNAYGNSRKLNKKISKVLSPVMTVNTTTKQINNIEITGFIAMSPETFI
jgi:hypothetical protein